MATLRPGPSRFVLTTAYELFINVNGSRRKVGLLQNINPTESKDVTRSFEIGSSQGQKIGECIELTPGLIKTNTLAVNRIRLNISSLLDAFGAEKTDGLYNQAIPFDIEESVTRPNIRADGTPDPDANNAVTETTKIYRDCIISDYSSTRDIGGDIREIEGCTIQVRAVDSLR